ncbi:protein FAR-RED ELONGATED HYPOCOTYL 3-like [Spinacia oleracea]|uniref:Protein FAR-RED ELONGATED HYPOCOTYL 3-like n=1 Tax=Spinacia oleracea TaxID=3562 RepID=A0ABM3QYM6_SPIOL|nr:protein FAR-RED ELONGATED HYPOCOTYL 3-like [Spinacia oleracea]
MLSRQKNGFEEVPLTAKDMHNILAKNRKLQTADGNPQAMDDYFNKMQHCNQDFYHIRRIDAGGYLKDILWIDARSREAYKDFGDAVQAPREQVVNLRPDSGGAPLSHMYNERHMWVPAYMRDIFWAGMKTTQRAESINRFFDVYLHKSTTSLEFATKYMTVMEDRCRTEVEADASQIRSTRRLV